MYEGLDEANKDGDNTTTYFEDLVSIDRSTRTMAQWPRQSDTRAQPTLRKGGGETSR